MNTKQQLFTEIDHHLLQDKEPSIFLNCIYSDSLFREYPFKMLTRLKETNQSLKHHPEGNVWNHTMMVIDAAALIKDRSKNQRVFMWAGLLHDVGKPDTTKIRNDKITSYDHDKFGAIMAKTFLKEFSDDKEFIENVSALVRWHMQILFVINSLAFAEIKKMKEQVDINEVALLGFCDRMGRLGANRKKEEENIKLFLQKSI